MNSVKISLTIMALAVLSWQYGTAFQPKPPISANAAYRSSTSLFALSQVTEAKQNVMDVAKRLKEKEGVLIVDSKAKADLKAAVAQLEASADPPTQKDFDSKFKGDWTLLCSTATNADGFDTSKVPFLNQGPLKSIRDYINRSLQVQQRIRSMTESGTVDRIDHVLEYQPPDTLKQLLDNLPDPLKTLNINPLHVTEGNVTLIHKAKVESVEPVLRTSLSLESIVLSVAGTTQFLDPNGSDLVGINVPWGEFLNAGSFDTTYMDDDIRISRGKLGVVDQLRVFIRSDKAEPFVEEPPVVDWDEEMGENSSEMGENSGEVWVGGASEETEQAVSDTNFEEANGSDKSEDDKPSDNSS
jgi:hypothetical protein